MGKSDDGDQLCAKGGVGSKASRERARRVRLNER